MTASTVGYGDISPSSVLGKIAVIIYLTGGDHDDHDRDYDHIVIRMMMVTLILIIIILVGKLSVIMYLTGYYHYLPPVSSAGLLPSYIASLLT